jgi:hypothetical protein
MVSVMSSTPGDGKVKGELASRVAIAAGPAGDRVHDPGLGSEEEALDDDLAARELQVHGGEVERVVGADRGERAREDPRPGSAGGVVQDSAEDSLVSEAPCLKNLCCVSWATR